MTRRIEFTVPDEVGELYDRARGDVPMAAWIKRALESALDGSSQEPPVPKAPAASSRASNIAARSTASAIKARSANAMERQAKLNEAKS